MAINPTILVVDDDDSILVLMRSLLRQRGFTPLTASSGSAALATLETGRPDLVLLDLGLQDMRGEEWIRRLRQRNDRTPVVIVSGQALSESELSAMGAAGAMHKPFAIDDLIRVIRESLEPVGC